jgi:ubiquinone/menaquinone biosynthesis C-methylase UbiE
MSFGSAEPSNLEPAPTVLIPERVGAPGTLCLSRLMVHSWGVSRPGERDSPPADTPLDPAYALARSQEEYERLSRQAAFLWGPTERLLQAAGLDSGMRVLDVGSGAGDIAVLTAHLVGPQGEVVGVDSDGAVLEIARGRLKRLGLTNVTLVEGDVRSAELVGHFDAVVGRLVLMYMADPAEALRRLADRVRPGGVVAFQEFDFDPTVASLSLPETSLWDETGRLVIETFARAGTQMRMGRRLFGTFLAAGLPTPTMRDEAVAGGGSDFAGYAWLAGVTRSLAPLMAKLAIADTDQLGLDTLADRIRDAAIASNAIVWTPSLVGAYARTPTR